MQRSALRLCLQCFFSFFLFFERCTRLCTALERERERELRDSRRPCEHCRRMRLSRGGGISCLFSSSSDECLILKITLVYTRARRHFLLFGYVMLLGFKIYDSAILIEKTTLPRLMNTSTRARKTSGISATPQLKHTHTDGKKFGPNIAWTSKPALKKSPAKKKQV